MEMSPRKDNESAQPTEGCSGCEHRRAMINSKQGIRIPGQSGKCIRPDGLCDKVAPSAPTVEVIEPLSEDEQVSLDELEALVTKSLRSVFECGFALREILEKRYYRDTHTTFEDYVENRFRFSRQSAYRMINAANVMDNVTRGLQNPPFGADISPTLPLPSNERQARPLAQLKADDQIVTWQTAVQTAPKGRITAAHVKKVVNQKLGKPPKKAAASHDEKLNGAIGELPEGFKEAFSVITEKVYIAKKNRFKDVDREKMIQIIDGLKRLLEG